MSGITVKLDDAFEDDVPPGRDTSPGCTVGKFMALLDSKDKDRVRAVLDGRGTTRGIATALNRHIPPESNLERMSDGTIYRHRRALCACASVGLG